MKTNELFENCRAFETVSIIILSENSDETSECLLSLFHNAHCPKAFKIVLIESVDTYQDESLSIQKYKKMAEFKGRYNLNFVDQIQVHQVKSTCLISDALHLMNSENKFTIVVQGDCQFLPEWDRFLDQANSLDAVNFGGLYLGAYEDKAAYTAISSFRGHAPIITRRPIWKPGNLRLSWPTLPMLFKTSVFKKLQSCSIYESQLEMAMSNTLYWTSKVPIATSRKDFFPTVDHQMPLEYYEKHKLLGLEKNANALEIISKFGSISSYHWSLSE